MAGRAGLRWWFDDLVLIYGHRLAVVRPVERLLQSMQRVREWRSPAPRGAGRSARTGLPGRGLNRMLDGLDQMQQALDRQKKRACSYE